MYSAYAMSTEEIIRTLSTIIYKQIVQSEFDGEYEVLRALIDELERRANRGEFEMPPISTR